MFAVMRVLRLPHLAQAITTSYLIVPLSVHPACTGSGKTRVTIARVVWLLSEGVIPENLLVITFTKNAAEQLQVGA